METEIIHKPIMDRSDTGKKLNKMDSKKKPKKLDANCIFLSCCSVNVAEAETIVEIKTSREDVTTS